MRNDKGITLIALIITVILLAVLAVASVRVGLNITTAAKFENIETYLLLIQSKVKTMSQDLVIGEIEENDLRGTRQDGGDYDGWYLLSQEDLNDMGVNKAKAEDGYYIDYDTDNVAYSKGISLDGNTFTKLSDILDYKRK